MKKRYISLFQAAVNQLQYCLNLESNIADMRKEISEYSNVNAHIGRINVLKENIAIAEKNKAKELYAFSETMKKIITSLPQLKHHLHLEDVENPIFKLYQAKVLNTVL